MLQLALRKAHRAQRPVRFLAADTLALPFADASCDAVALAFGLRNLANYVRGIQEIRRVLKPGGLLAVLEFSRVRWPVFGPLFRFYFRHILPRLGTWVSGIAGPYQYLPNSVSVFPDQESLASILRGTGFQNVRYINLTGGVAALHLGEKA
jgi:demethylmenaquinone methyltransferase/2-methoxy-6-polyprenyl-1,4-benzoquinol methylase